MPGKLYIHPCGFPYRFAKRCRDCGAEGIYDGWDGVMYDKMAAYARKYGVKPMGRHLGLTERLFDGLEMTCGGCGGRGYLSADADHCRLCERCSACGTVFTLPPEEVAALRAQIAAAFPDGVQDPPHVEGPFILCHATGEMISSKYPRGQKENDGRSGSSS